MSVTQPSDGLAVSLGPDWDPSRPAARIYVSGFQYKLVSGRIPHAPLAGAVKLINNWTGPAGRIAKNIWYMLFVAGAPTSDPTFLKAVANAAMTNWAGNATFSNVANVWTLSSITAKDAGESTGVQATSDHSPIPGTGADVALPPQCAITLSWPVPVAYRGGRPRWYLPGAMSTALASGGNSALSASVATGIANAANTWLNAMNAATITSGGTTYEGAVGTISFQLHHVARPSPLFLNFGRPEVHERIDSQRRRSGKESSFGEVP